MSEKKTDQAMRMLEALDGVDPMLLARSEKTKKIIPFQRYARIAAACLAVVFAGGVMFVTVQNGGVFQKSATSEAPRGMANGTSADSARHFESAVRNNEGVVAEETVPEAYEQQDHSTNGVEQFEAEYEDATNDRTAETATNSYKADIADEQKISDATKGAQGTRLEDLMTKLGIRGKTEVSASEQAALAMTKMALTLQGNATTIENGENVGKVCDYLNSLSMEAVTGETEAQDFEENVVLVFWDADGAEVERIAVDGDRLRFGDGDMLYRITDEAYVYEDFCKWLENIVREEME